MKHSLRFYTGEVFRHMNRTPFIFGPPHLEICRAFDDVVRGRTRKLIVNIPPRYGKTELTRMLMSQGFALNPAAKFLLVSYSASLAEESSSAVKDILKSAIFRYHFDARIARGKDARKKWSTVQGGGLYAVSTLGQITGFGAGVTDREEDEEIDEHCVSPGPDGFAGAVVIDDPIKPQDALSDNVREAVNLRFETTIRNRVNSRRTPIVIICQRTHERDLCGYLLEAEPGEWTVLSMPAISVDGDGRERALWEHKHTLAELRHIETVSPFVFETQYMQNPTPLEGLLYAPFKTYDVMPQGKGVAKNYTDSADTGSDFHCSVCYVEYPTGCYVTDVLYNQKPMEYNEVEQPAMLERNGTAVAVIESNNGGRGFARNVEKALRMLGNRSCRVETFTQTQNKAVRIFTRSAEVQNMIYFPSGWEHRWPQFAAAVKSYRKEGRNAHDDAPDVLTGIVENMTPKNRTTFYRT